MIPGIEALLLLAALVFVCLALARQSVLYTAIAVLLIVVDLLIGVGGRLYH